MLAPDSQLLDPRPPRRFSVWCLRACRCHPRRVEAARPQVQVALLPFLQSQKVSLNLEILLHWQVRSNLQVSSRFQPRRHAVLLYVVWSARTLVSWQHTLVCDDILDEPRCTTCSLASKSTSHHELSALPEMVLNLKDSRRTNKIVRCTFANVVVTLFTRQSSHCSDLYDTTRSSNQVCVWCRVSSQPNFSSPTRIIFVSDSFSLQPVTSFTKLHRWFLFKFSNAVTPLR